MKIFTIGFTGKTAEHFFSLVSKSGANKVLDIRLNKSSQLAGFAKDQDLGFFLLKLSGVEYEAMPTLAPSKDLLDAYRSRKIDWATFEKGYIELIQDRKIFEVTDKTLFVDCVLLCSENEPDRCHRRVLAELISSHFDNFEVIHLV